MVSNRRSDREDFKFGQKKLKFWREIWILAGNLNFFAIFGQICHLLGIKLSLELIASCFGYQINPGTSRVPIWAKKFQILAGNLNFFGQNCNIASKYSLWQVTASHNYAYWVCSGYQNYPLAKQSTNLGLKILCLVTYNIILAINMVSRAYMQQKVVAIVVKMGSQYAQLLRNWLELASILFMGCWDTSWLWHI